MRGNCWLRSGLWLIALRVRGGASHGPTPEQLLQIEGASYFNSTPPPPNPAAQEERALSSLFSFIPWPPYRDPGPWGPFRGQLVLRLSAHNSPPLHVHPSKPVRRQIAIVQWDSRGKSVIAFNSREEERWTKRKEKEGILGASSSLSATCVTTSEFPSERSVMWRRFSLRDQKL
jgi:hypothetical protein